MVTPTITSDESGRACNAMSRRFGPLTVGGIRHSTLTLCSTALGGGVLAVSYVMKVAGLGLGILMLVTGAGLAFASTKVLMRACQQTGHDTYAGLFAHCAGRRGGVILDAMLVVYGNGACVGYLVFVADFVPAIVILISPHAPAWLASRWLAIVVAGCIMLPMVVQRDVAALRYFTPVSIMALVYTAMTVAVKSAYRVNEDDPKRGHIRLAIPSLNLLDAFAICVFAFNCHMNVVPVAGNMVRATKARIVKVSAMVNLVQLTFYLLIGITGYLSFLQETPQDIIKGYAADDIGMAVARFALLATMLVAIPTNSIPTVRSGLRLIEHLCPGVLGEDPRLLADAAAEGAAASNGGMPAEAPRSPPVTFSPQGPRAGLVRVVMSVGFLFLQVILAIVVPGVADVLSLLGATIATAMIMAIPAYCMGKIQILTPKKRMLQATFYFFSLVSLASVPVKILTWCKVIS